MLEPVRTTAGWLAGRLILLAVVMAALVVFALYRPQLALFGAQAASRLPDAEFTARLERSRAAFQAEALTRVRDVNARLAAAGTAADAAIATRLVEIEALVRAAEARRRSSLDRTLALLTGEGIEQDLRNELDLELLAVERSAWQQVTTVRAVQARELRELEDAASEAYARARGYYDGTYLPALQSLNDSRRSAAGRMRGALSRVSPERAYDEALAQYELLRRELRTANTQLALARRGRAGPTPVVALEVATFLRPLDDAIAERRVVLTTRDRLATAARAAFWQALAIVIALSLAPLAIKAFWYHGVAPLIARRPPVRLSNRPWPTEAVTPGMAAGRERISAVSQEIVLRDGEELLVHPEFLQSSADRGHKRTQWLLDWRLPLTSLATRLVGLTRVHGAAGASFVVSSKTNPLCEVGLLHVPAGAEFVLHPRHLAGLVHRTEAPVRITRRWRFGAGAFITLQFRYLLFAGPVTLIVQGTRGIRLEAAGSGRSIDQRATIGFSANLAYAPRRSETFGAYLLGLRGLFNDHFRDGPGVYAYEEMPYAGRRGGITGRGLDGLADGLLRAFGI